MNIRTSNLKDPVKDKAACQLVFCPSSRICEVFFPPQKILKLPYSIQPWIKSGSLSVVTSVSCSIVFDFGVIWRTDLCIFLLNEVRSLNSEDWRCQNVVEHS